MAIPEHKSTGAKRRTGRQGRFAILAAAALACLMSTQTGYAQDASPAKNPGSANDKVQTTPAAKAAQPQPGSPSSVPAQQPGTVRANYGAWSIVCDTPAGAANQQCALMQNVIAEDRPEVGLSVVVLKTADRKAKILRILAPLGVLLKDGMELYVDNNNIGRANFTRCFAEGCYVEVEIDDKLMQILRNGKSAVFAVRESADQDRIGIPVALNGFAQGYDALP